ncbi:abhydrolase domain-containing protein 2 [Venturia canescens]|uniref:abhydrolase domain-containing protein 2 n=1 Tax=Venturia canescens TaxID=32260 RepID=UPI001C9C654A|nr:abhydrolase domain-containing protein 2 [Venturia canescens]XP_043288097.1 abhydrolase domain-containing protein 2 [Venturia canescens]XP_043288098.1 abhydrolase domain-containing protein 2 [Venturia canescens]XP_043288099.1 abhydrolase domain-containing protein 2 [Venturia canescens]XP_043288101.1 abhydrolase domain-containing protein 2 [Venturia canescens]XP_043288102.1 abhydrolase domain-containing protein 2 [Venturia canescens]XP_043288103.1 abhydrolase domain-containing protein 2 [Ven
MSTALLAVFAVVLIILFRILNVNSSALKPVLYCQDNAFVSTILKIAPVIAEPYKPTRLWGFSGHVQTVVHSIIGRVRCPWPIGERVVIPLPDETTLTYDLYQPLTNVHEDDITIAICPGIGNSSESVYIRTFVHFVQCHGYRCAVLNHVGALSSVKVTAPRIFTYGHTDDYHVMLSHLVEKHAGTRIVCVGFSLGGNLVTKYMGERGGKTLPQIIGGISICQGYNAIDGTKFLLNWTNFRRFYLYIMTESVKNIILRHKDVLLSREVQQRFGLNERDIISAATLPELDEAYTRKVHNFRSVKDLYKWSSSINYIGNISIPMVFMNALDDPLVPEMLLVPIRDFAAKHKNVLYIELAHGGHLGFYEGGLIYPNPITWLDRTIVSLVGSLTLVHADRTKVS